MLTVKFDLDLGQGIEGEIKPVIVWRRDGEVIKNVIGSQYRPFSSDVGKVISVEVLPEFGNGIRGKAARAELSNPLRRDLWQRDKRRRPFYG